MEGGTYFDMVCTVYVDDTAEHREAGTHQNKTAKAVKRQVRIVSPGTKKRIENEGVEMLGQGVGRHLSTRM